ncbi:MAG: choice-of-anchor X domain-containing protein [Candidatus Krumholzibacteriia bacterium]
MRRPLILALAALALVASAALAQTVQTITIDGINDFDPGNLVDADGGDTEFAEIDLGNIYLTNDANNLYLGYDHSQGGWGTVQLGVAIDVNTTFGGTTDPWSRKLEWSGAATKPDFIYYINLDSNWQASYRWNPGPGTWTGVVAGPGALGVPTATAFREYAFSLASLGVEAGDLVHVEVWVTQDGSTKGPLDAAANDAVQLSTPDGTTYDVTVPVPMTVFHSFTILDASDTVAPAVLQVGMEAQDAAYVRFSEAVDPATANVAGHYSLPGATILTASVDGSQPDLVHLVLAADLPVAADLYTITVSSVADLAGNPIADQDTGDFLWKAVHFTGRMSRYLAGNSTPPDGFTVEGGVWPLTWTLCDNAEMADEGDGVFTWSGNFSAPGDGAGSAGLTFEWKFVHNCTTYEPLPQNRTHTVTLDGSDTDAIDVWWADEDPSQFTTHAVDVIFTVDMSAVAPAATDTVAIAGNVAPLDQAWPPAVAMLDDGQGQDAVAGDLVFTAVVTFAADSRKDVTYKFRWNGDYECFDQADRDVYLNDAEFDVIGGDLGPLVLPTYTWDYCMLSPRAVEVIFRLDATNMPHAGHAFSVNGTRSNEEPPAFSWDIPSLNPLFDDGIAPDETAGDGIYTASVVFPAGSNLFTEYKYLVDDVYEGFLGNRGFGLDPFQFDAVGDPQILGPDQLTTPVGVGQLPAATVSDLRNAPNPFNPSTEIRFTINRAGEGSLRVFDLQGKLVRTLFAGRFTTGAQSYSWDGRDDRGTAMASGVYLYRLTVAGEVGSRKMVLVQ